MTRCICHNEMFDADIISLFIKDKIYVYKLDGYYNEYFILEGVFRNFKGGEYISKNQLLQKNLFNHYFIELTEHRDNNIEMLLT